LSHFTVMVMTHMQVPEDRDLILYKDSLRYTFSDSIIKF
jgi:hypothetical protein